MQKIFISSTFRDMQAERDAIHTVVVPQLRAMAQKYGEDVEVCDLRWGVNTGDLDSEAGSKKVLSVCLDEIDKCRPFMMVMLGERYGWIPESELLEGAANRKNYTLKELEKSVTALEIEYGALSDPEVLKRSLFLFREPMPEADADYHSEGPEYAKKLEELKKRIRNLAGDRVFFYQLSWDEEKKCPTKLEHFTKIVIEQLRNMLEQEWKDYALLSENQKEEKRHWGSVERKAGQFAGRSSLLLHCKHKLEMGGGTLLLEGETGSGKSTLWSKMVLDYREQGWNVYPFICGNSGRSASAMDILKQWIAYVEELLGTEHFEEKHCVETQEWRGRLRDVLDMYCEKKGFPPLLLAADGLEQLFPDKMKEDWGFLPVFKWKKVSFLLSGSKEDNRERYHGECITIPAISEQEKPEVLMGILDYQSKGLDQVVMDEIMKKQEVDNPLYLSLLMQLLTMMDKDDFAVISEYGNDMAAINHYQIELIKNAPSDSEEMSRLLIREAGKRINPELVNRMAEYIAVSRQGLRESDLKALLKQEGISWNSLDFSRMINYVPMLFAERKNGQIDLSYKVIRQGLQKGIKTEKMLHNIFLHLKRLPMADEVRSNEMVYYCYVLDEKKELVKYLSECRKQQEVKALKQAAQELYGICRKDSGEWFMAVLQEIEEPQYGRDLFVFVWDYFAEAFTTESEAELEIQLKIGSCILEISKKWYEDLKSAEYARDYSVSCGKMGDIYRKLGRLSQALKRYEEGMAVSGKLYMEQESPVDVLDYCISCERLADIYERFEEFEKALDKYREVQEIRWRLKKMHQIEQVESADHILCERMGRIYEKQGRLSEALKKYEEGLDLSRQLHAVQKNSNSAKAYSISCESVGGIYEKQGRLEEALKQYREVLTIRKNLYEEQGTLESARNYSITCGRLGLLYKKQGRVLEALDLYTESLVISRKLYEEFGIMENAAEYSVTSEKIGDMFLEEGKYEQALKMYQKGQEVSSKLYDRLETPEWERTYIGFCEKVGYTYHFLGKLPEALGKYMQVQLYFQNRCKAQKTPENIWKYGITCGRIGDIYKAFGAVKEALEHHKEFLYICRDLYQTLGTEEIKVIYGRIKIEVFMELFLLAGNKKYKKPGNEVPFMYSKEGLSEEQIRYFLASCTKGRFEEEILMVCIPYALNPDVSPYSLNPDGRKGYVFTKKGIYTDYNVKSAGNDADVKLPLLYEDIVKCEYEELFPDRVTCILKGGSKVYFDTGNYGQFYCEVINEIVSVLEGEK